MTRHQFLKWFQARALDIAQPDVGRCGITEAKKIADLAETFNIPRRRRSVRVRRGHGGVDTSLERGSLP